MPVPREEEEEGRRRRRRERKNEEASLQGTTRFVLGEGEGIPSIFFLFTDGFPDFSLFSLVFPVHIAFLGGGGTRGRGQGQGQKPKPTSSDVLRLEGWCFGLLPCSGSGHKVRYIHVAKVHDFLVSEENGPLGARVTT